MRIGKTPFKMTQPFEAHLQLATYLQHATSPDKATRDQAEAGIRQLEQADWAAFVSSLASELANESSPEIGRQMASVLLKNALDAKDSRVKVSISARADLCATNIVNAMFDLLGVYRLIRLLSGKVSTTRGRLRSGQHFSRLLPARCAIYTAHMSMHLSLISCLCSWYCNVLPQGAASVSSLHWSWLFACRLLLGPAVLLA